MSYFTSSWMRELMEVVRTPMLGAYAAKQCPYRTWREHDPTETAEAAPADDALQQLFDEGISFEVAIVAEILALHPGRAIAIPGRDEADHEHRRALTDRALADATPLILGALMQPDVDGRRLAEIDLLVATGRQTVAGKPEYRAVDVKSHRCTINDARATDIELEVHDLRLLDNPQPVQGVTPKYREDDCLQLAHYHRVLQAHGYADPDGSSDGVSGDGVSGNGVSGAVWGGIIGLEGIVAWHDLARAEFATVTPQERGDDNESSITFHRRQRSSKRTALDRYDFEFDFRLRVADAAVQRTSSSEPSLVDPVWVKECDRCPWQEPCRSELEAIDDVSLVTPVGYPEWRVHRFTGNRTVRQLAALDPIDAAVTYADTPLTELALTKQIQCARAVVAGRPLVATEWDESSIPRGDLEIDLDLENDQFVYLWGARLTVVPEHWPESAGTYAHFSSFEPLDADGEAELAGDLWAWLDDLRQRAHHEDLTVRIYGYSADSVEGAALRRLVPDGDVDTLIRSDDWVDLLPYMRRKFWSNDGHGLKVMAAAHGFAWRDDDPGGYASMQWYRDALAGVDRTANIERILAYNDDDCAATAALRGC